MKKHLVSILLALFGFAACGSDAPEGAAAAGSARAEQGLVIENPTSPRDYFHDFGSVLFGERLRHVYRLRNTHGTPVTISQLQATCSCTQPRIGFTRPDGEIVNGSRTPGEPILVLPPGMVADLAIEIDTRRVERMNFDKLAQVRLISDSPTTPYLTFELHLLVRRAFRSVPEEARLGLVPQSFGKSVRVDVTHETRGDPDTVVGVAQVEGSFGAQVQRGEIAGVAVWALTVSVPAGLPLGPANGLVRLDTLDGAGQPGPQVEVPVSAQIVGDVVMQPETWKLVHPRGRASQDSGELSTLVPGVRSRVSKTSVQGEGAEFLRLSTTPIDADADGRATRFRAELALDARLDLAVFRGELVFEFDDARIAPLAVPYVGTTR